jgi:hypothetical protein
MGGGPGGNHKNRGGVELAQPPEPPMYRVSQNSWVTNQPTYYLDGQYTPLWQALVFFYTTLFRWHCYKCKEGLDFEEFLGIKFSAKWRSGM